MCLLMEISENSGAFSKGWQRGGDGGRVGMKTCEVVSQVVPAFWLFLKDKAGM